VNSTEFIENKYKRWYFSIVEKAQNRDYDRLLHEKHHIIPSSIGGSNDPENIVCLLYREHFICHWLLTKFTKSIAKGKMCGALRMMMNKSSFNNRVLTNRHYEIARTALSRTKRIVSEQFKKHQSEIKMGIKNPMFGRKQSEETKQKISMKLNVTQDKLSCPYCKRIGGVSNMKRYHYNNCKKNTGI